MMIADSAEKRRPCRAFRACRYQRLRARSPSGRHHGLGVPSIVQVSSMLTAYLLIAVVAEIDIGVRPEAHSGRATAAFTRVRLVVLELAPCAVRTAKERAIRRPENREANLNPPGSLQVRTPPLRRIDIFHAIARPDRRCGLFPLSE